MAVTRYKFHEKASIVYACAQIDETTSCILSPAETSGQITVNGTTVTGTSTTKFKTQVAKGSYLYYVVKGTTKLIGKVASISSDTSLTIAASLLATGETVTSQEFGTTLGPDNEIPTLNLTYSLDLTSEAFQYTGDYLSRDETTVITDKIGKLEFETFFPVLLKDVTAATITSDVLPYLPLFNSCGLVATGETGTITSNIAGKLVKLTNSSASDTFLTVIIRQSAVNDADNDKLYIMTGVRGTVDYSSVIGTKPKLKWSLQGNALDPMDRKKFTNIGISDVTKLHSTAVSIKKSISDTIKSDVINSAYLVNLNATTVSYDLSDSAVAGWITGRHPITIAGLILNIGGATVVSTTAIIEAFDGISAGTTAAQANLINGFTVPTDAAAYTSYWFTGTLSSNYSLVKGQNKVTGAYTVIKAIPVAGFTVVPTTTDAMWKSSYTTTGTGGAVSTITLAYTPLTTETTNTYVSSKDICFDKLNAPNLVGYEYTRYKTGCFDGWSKGAVPTDVTLTILEDSANATFNPYNGLEQDHALWFGYVSGSTNVTINFSKIQLTNIAKSTVANFMGQDLTFRNKENVTIYLQWNA